MSDPIIHEDGIDSEFFARMQRLRVTYSCAVCKFHCGAEWNHIEGSRLPPELRSIEEWQQEAKAQANNRQSELWKLESRARFDAHLCHCANCNMSFKDGQMVAIDSHRRHVHYSCDQGVIIGVFDGGNVTRAGLF